MVFVTSYLCDTCSDLLLPFVAVFRKLGEEHPRTRSIAQLLFDRKTVRSFILFEKLVVSRKDICPITGDDAVNLLIHLVFIKGTFEALVPSFRFDLTLGIDLCCLAGCGDTGINRSLSFFRDFGLFAEKDYVECCALVHSCMGLEWLNVYSIGVL